ncbi:hypothetical protein D4764_01G0019650 [Takifugu flavidus]|uniref:Uncharacterized protein n=1 Tax=Takifugu flavidus TaxID=433684 RepID=A0A5C6PUC4_9TELE|nr:hypothetical protein D4764_01G0019650 [Takifugu flavidus]
MKPPCSDDLIAYLNEYIWERVKDEDICITDDSFKKMDNKIQKILRKELGNPNKVLFLLKYSEEPVVADCMVTILRKLLKRPSKKRNIFSKDEAPVYQRRRVLVFSLVSTAPNGSGERARLDPSVGSAVELLVHPRRLDEFSPTVQEDYQFVC